MSNAFRVKNRLNLTPQATEPTGLELGDLWMDAEGTLKRWDGTASQDVGSGGVGSVDIMFADTFDATNISEYTTTGTVAVTDNVLEVIQGKKSLKITHTGGASAERVIPVDIKFRNKNVTLSFDVESDALSGNLTLTVVDETNTVTLINAESIQPQGTLDTSIKRSVSFIIPDDCEELKYTFNAVSESAKISIIDNVVIELTQTAKMSTTIEVPVITEWVDAGPITITATTTSPTKATTKEQDNVRWRQVGDSYEVEYRYNAASATGAANGSGDYVFSLPNGVEITDDISNQTSVANLYLNPQALGTMEVVGVVGGSGSAAGLIKTAVKYSSNSFRIRGENEFNTSATVSSGNYALNQANLFFYFTVKFRGKNLQATESQEVSLAQAVLKQESDSVLHVASVLGYGSPNTRVVRFDPAKIQKSLGTAITYIPSATLGDSFKINEAGVYQINATVAFTTTTGGAFPYIVKNPTNLAQSNSGLVPQNEVIAHSYTHGGASSNPDMPIAANVYLEKDDVIWVTNPVASPVALTTGDNRSYIQITKQGSLKQVNVTENQKIEIPTSELRMEGASTRGTGSDSAIVRFDNIAKLRGDAFTVESTAALGTVITMKKKGKLSINSSLLFTTAIGQTLTINQTDRTTATAIPSAQSLSSSGVNATNSIPNASWTGFVNIGDVLRVAAASAPATDTRNNLNLSFQEQEVAVSVTNVLPQFSESDSSIRVDTANGYGSPTGTRIRRFSNVRDNLGTAITYVPSDVNGDSFRINEDGIYHISFSDYTSGGAYIGITLNSSNLSTNVTTLMQAANNEVLSHTSVSTNNNQSCSWSGYLQKDDVIRAHTDSNASLDVDAAKFTISKVGKPNVTGVDVTPFAKIEYEVKQFIEMRGYSAFGASATRIPFFPTATLNTNNGVIRVDSDSTLGTRLVVLKKCELNLNLTIATVNGRSAGFSKNSNQLSTDIQSITSSHILAIDGVSSGTGGSYSSISNTIIAEVGDVIRPHYGNDPIGDSTAFLSVTATELRDAYQVIGGGVENTYSARITNNGTAAIASQSYPFIQSVVHNSVGNVTINLVPGFFTVTPNVVATNAANAQSAADRVTQLYSSTTTSIGIITNGNGGLIDYDFNIMVQRQGSDYRTPSKAIGLPQQRIAYIKDVKAAGTAGGSFTGGSWQTRTLNNLVDPSGMVTSLASNQFVLPAGTYDFYATAPATVSAAVQIERHKLKLRNVTDSTDTLIGQSAVAQSQGSTSIVVESISTISGRFTITSPKTFELQHRCVSTHSAGFGIASNFGVDEVYSQIKLTKLEE
jgi:hypothetical protein